MEKHTNPIEFDAKPNEKAIDPSEYAKRIAELNDRFCPMLWPSPAHACHRAVG